MFATKEEKKLFFHYEPSANNAQQVASASANTARGIAEIFVFYQEITSLTRLYLHLMPPKAYTNSGLSASKTMTVIVSPLQEKSLKPGRAPGIH